MYVLRYPSMRTPFQTFRNMEIKMSQHIRRTCLWSVTLEVTDIALNWMFTPANNNKSLSVHAKCYNEEVMSPGCLLLIYLGLLTN